MRKPIEERFHAACNRLGRQFRSGELVLEATKTELRFRYRVPPTKGYVLRIGDHCYAAVVQKSDWPTDVPLLRSVA